MDNTQKERIEKAQDKALERLDYILETAPALDFVEIIGCMGGDTVLTGYMMMALCMSGKKI